MARPNVVMWYGQKLLFLLYMVLLTKFYTYYLREVLRGKKDKPHWLPISTIACWLPSQGRTEMHGGRFMQMTVSCKSSEK